MYWSVSCAAVLMALPWRATAQAPEPYRAAVSVIQTSGTGNVSISADLATVTIQFTATGRSPRRAGEAAARRTNAIRAAIEALGVPADSMPTGGRWGWWAARSQMMVSPNLRDTSYVTSDVFTVRVRELGLLGRVIDTALVQGAQTISSVNFTATDTRAAELAALALATQHARENAEAIARAASASLGNIIELSTEPPSASYGGPVTMAQITMVSATANPTTIVAPRINVSMSVYAKWELRTSR